MRTAILGFIVGLGMLSGAFSSGQAQEDDQLLEIAERAFSLSLAAPSSQRASVFRSSLDGLDDRARTRAIAGWLFVRDERDGRMRPGPGVIAADVIREDLDLIEDLSELKTMLAEEEDVRRFYTLAGMSAPFAHVGRGDFVSSCAHMLYRREQLALMHGDYFWQSLTNASYFTYGFILRNLKALDAGFPEPSEKLSYEERIPILIEWLKENWPGCEHLSVPGTGQPHGRSGTDAVGVAEPAGEQTDKLSAANAPNEREPVTGKDAAGADRNDGSKSWFWLAGAILVLALLATLRWASRRPSRLARSP